MVASACQCESTLQHELEGAYRAVKCVEKMISIIHWQAEPAPGQMFLIQLKVAAHACSHWHADSESDLSLATIMIRPYLEGHWLINLTSTIFSLPSPSPGSVYTDLEIRLEWPL